MFCLTFTLLFQAHSVVGGMRCTFCLVFDRTVQLLLFELVHTFYDFPFELPGGSQRTEMLDGLFNSPMMLWSTEIIAAKDESPRPLETTQCVE